MRYLSSRRKRRASPAVMSAPTATRLSSVPWRNFFGEKVTRSYRPPPKFPAASAVDERRGLECRRRKEERGIVRLREEGPYEIGQKEGADRKRRHHARNAGFLFAETEEKEAEDAPAVEGIRGEEIDEEEGKGDRRRELGIGVGLGKGPPERDEKDARREVCKRPRGKHGELLSSADPLHLPRDDRAVGHEHDPVEGIAVPPRHEGMRTLMLEGGEEGGEKEEEPSRKRGKRAHRPEEGMNAHPDFFQLQASVPSAAV